MKSTLKARALPFFLNVMERRNILDGFGSQDGNDQQGPNRLDVVVERRTKGSTDCAVGIAYLVILPSLFTVKSTMLRAPQGANRGFVEDFTNDLNLLTKQSALAHKHAVKGLQLFMIVAGNLI